MTLIVYTLHHPRQNFTNYSLCLTNIFNSHSYKIKKRTQKIPVFYLSGYLKQFSSTNACFTNELSGRIDQFTHTNYGEMILKCLYSACHVLGRVMRTTTELFIFNMKSLYVKQVHMQDNISHQELACYLANATKHLSEIIRTTRANNADCSTQYVNDRRVRLTTRIYCI